MWCIWCLLLILIKKLVWHAEHEWVNFFNKFGLHQSKTEGDTEDWIRDKVWNMLARNLKSVRGMRKKRKPVAIYVLQRDRSRFSLCALRMRCKDLEILRLYRPVYFHLIGDDCTKTSTQLQYTKELQLPDFKLQKTLSMLYYKWVLQ